MGGSRIRIHWSLEPRMDSARFARGFLEIIPDLAPYPDLLFAAQLVTHELVSNSIRHGNLRSTQAVELDVSCDGRALVVDVSHPGEAFNALDALAIHYRRTDPHYGLFLLDTLADRWGFRRAGHTWGVSFELDLIPGRNTWHGRQPIDAGGRARALRGSPSAARQSS